MLLLVLRPLSSPDLWWNLARGREVLSGTLFPSRSLLALDVASEADWCSAVPFYIIWLLGGVHGLSAVPLLSAAALIFLAARRVPRERRASLAIFGLPLLVWTMREGLDPGPRLFDLIGLAALWSVFETGLSVRSRAAAVFLIFAIWANLGPRPVWGLLFLFLVPGYSLVAESSRESQAAAKRRRPNQTSQVPVNRFQITLVAAALLGGMLTPRGLLTWRDSAILFAPSSFASLETFGEPGWHGIISRGALEPAVLAFLVLWLTWCVERLMRPRPHSSAGDPRQPASFERVRPLFLEGVRCGVPLLAALICRANLPACGLWILLDLLRRDPATPTAAEAPGRPHRQIGIVLTGAVVAVLVVVDAAGSGLPPYRRLGWGISSELNPQLLDPRLFSIHDEPVVGWAPDGRSVGIVAWLKGNVKLADHPQRALLGGRVPRHAAIIEDLLGSHRARYRRDDGSWGGWVRQLSDWRVEQLFVPAEQIPLNLALLKTPWKAADLDSPTVPYVSGHDAKSAQFILEALQQQAFVEVGPWQPTEDIYAAAGWRYDFVELLGGGPDPSPAIVQSQLFRSLDIPLAALRALLPIRRQRWSRSLAGEFLACQHELAYQEWHAFGESSSFRRRVLRAIQHERPTVACPPWLAQSNADKPSEIWSRCVELYLRGRLGEAVGALPLDDPQQQYAAAMIWLENGDSAQSLDMFDRLLSTNSERWLMVAAKSWRQQIEPFVRQ